MLFRSVLGVDIGGGTRDDAVKKLDDAFGGRVDEALKLSVGGKFSGLVAMSSGHGLGERHLPFQAKRCRHSAIAVCVIAVAGVITVCPGKQRIQSQQ